jgi:hypothetical protein
LFKINNTEIVLKNNNLDLEIFKFFDKNVINDIFINDIVFLEENKNKFNLNKIINEIDKSTYIIFPMRNNIGKLI